MITPHLMEHAYGDEPRFPVLVGPTPPFSIVAILAGAFPSAASRAERLLSRVVSFCRPVTDTPYWRAPFPPPQVGERWI